MDTPGEQKRALRRTALERRRALTPDAYAVRSAAIAERLQFVPEFATASAILTYVASLDNEADTKPIIRNALTAGRTLLVPIARKGGRMDWSRLASLKELAPSTFGVLEPRADAERLSAVPPHAVALVPGLLFTRDGYRIGYGGGYYDRFLAGFDGLSIGLAFDLQWADAVPVEPHDVRLDMVVTESRTVRFRD